MNNCSLWVSPEKWFLWVKYTPGERCCGQRWHDSRGLAFKSFDKSAAELEMTTNLKEDTLFIKSYQRASHATEKPFCRQQASLSFEGTNSHPASATTRLVTKQLSNHQQPKRRASAESSVASCLLSAIKYF